MKVSTLLLLCTTAAFFLGSCTSGPETPGGYRLTGTLLSFPDGKFLIESSIILHEVKIFFEMSREPKINSKGFPVEEPMLGPVPGPGERYRAGYLNASGTQIDPSTAHDFSYEAGKFVVGNYRYPSARYAQLYILQERSGELTFNFKGRTVTIEMIRTWKPAVLYRPVREVEELPAPEEPTGRRPRRPKIRQTITHLLREEVQAGPHRIVAFPDTNRWLVNQSEENVPPGATITINRRGEVITSS